MDAATLLASLKARFSGYKAGRITIGADELAEWPSGMFEQLCGAGLLKQIEPAQSLECQGCEEGCVMPVSILPAEASRPARAFIACDKRSDISRVRVAFTRLHQWQLTQAGFDALQRDWTVPDATQAGKPLKKIKAPMKFRSALEPLLLEIERRAKAQGLPFDRKAMPGRKVDLQALANKFDAGLDHTERTFDEYLEGSCWFKRGARETDFYWKLFPEFAK